MNTSKRFIRGRQALCLLLFCLFFFPFPSSLQAGEHALFSRVLKKHVRRGLVDYKGIKKNPSFKAYIQQLEKTNPSKIKGQARQLAFWINVYNAYTLKLIIDHYPLKSITDLHAGGSLWFGVATGKTIWKKWKFSLYAKKYTLDQVEHEIIRVKFKEPRIHAALVCAAKSCPPLRSEAYEGKKLERQLKGQMRQWLGNRKLNRFSAKEKKLYLSKIFDWFEGDFTASGKTLLEFLLPYLPSQSQKEIRKLGLSEVKISHLNYDWSLNER